MILTLINDTWSPKKLSKSYSQQHRKNLNRLLLIVWSSSIFIFEHQQLLKWKKYFCLNIGNYSCFFILFRRYSRSYCSGELWIQKNRKTWSPWLQKQGRLYIYFGSIQWQFTFSELNKRISILKSLRSHFSFSRSISFFS